jgi:hypothetical protein
MFLNHVINVIFNDDLNHNLALYLLGHNGNVTVLTLSLQYLDVNNA